MKKNFKKVSAVLMLAAATTFTMTSCGGGMTEEEIQKAADEAAAEVDAMFDEALEGGEDEMKCEPGKCEGATDGDAAASDEVEAEPAH